MDACRTPKPQSATNLNSLLQPLYLAQLNPLPVIVVACACNLRGPPNNRRKFNALGEGARSAAVLIGHPVGSFCRPDAKEAHRSPWRMSGTAPIVGGDA